MAEMTRSEVKAFYEDLVSGPLRDDTEAAVLRWVVGTLLELTEDAPVPVADSSPLWSLSAGSLGDALRAGRLGYRYLKPIGMFVRFTDLFEGGLPVGFICECVPPGDFPSGRTKLVEHRCWWESDDATIQELVDVIKPCLGNRPVQRVLRFNDDGTPR